MKLCASPRNTSCVYQRIARDQAAPDDAQAGAPDAYEELATFLQQNLSPDVLAEAATLLRRFVDQTGNLGTDDEPSAAQNSPLMTMDERVAVGAQIRAGKTLARQFLFAKRFPNAGRIRSIG